MGCEYMKLSIEDKFLQASIYVLLLLFSFICIYPFWNSLAISFNTGLDTMRGGVTFIPRHFTFENYYVVLLDPKILNALMISILRTAAGTFLSLLFTSAFAFGLSKRDLVGKRFYMILCLVTIYFSGGLIPSFLLMRSLHLIDTFWVLILPGMISIFNMIIFRTYFLGLPDGVEESAKIDGCNHIGVFFRIIIPISGPVIAALGLFTAVSYWNDWFTAAIYINNPNLLPIQTYLTNIVNSASAKEQLSSAAGVASEFINNNGVTVKSLVVTTMIVATIPVIAVYPFVQKYFVKGVLIGSLKG